MPDAIQILKPGWRALDGNADVLPGAVLTFFDAGTSNPREVFSNFALSSSLGVSVTCDAGGYPASSGNAKVEIYTGASPYKVVLKTSAGATVWSHDNIIGALDTSGFLLNADIVPSTPVENTATGQSIEADNKGTMYNVNCSGGDVTMTLDDAANLGDGFFVKIRHDGTANAVRLVTTGGDLMKIGSHGGVAAFALTRRGQVVTVTCDGVGFQVEQTSPALFSTAGVILVAGRRATAPVGALPGARYIATAAADWGSLSVLEHDIVEADGQGSWFKITPPTNCGWLAYIQADNGYRSFKATWDLDSATDTFTGKVELADVSEMEAATDLLRPVTPARQHRHPGHCKAWVNLNGTGTIAIRDDYGLSSAADEGTGHYTFNFDTAFSDTDYGMAGWCKWDGAGTSGLLSAKETYTKAASAMQIGTGNATTGSATDSSEVSASWFGDQ